MQLANEAKAGKFGVDAQANEIIAQINMAAQARALSLYEEALASLRKGDNQRARALLTEVAADETFDDESLQAKVQGLLEKLSPEQRRAGNRLDRRRRPGRRDASRPRSSMPRSAPRSPKPVAITRSIPTRPSRSTRRPCRPSRRPGSRPS